MQSEDSNYQYCNKIFGSWDYSILTPESVVLKHKSMYNELAVRDNSFLYKITQCKENDTNIKVILHLPKNNIECFCYMTD